MNLPTVLLAVGLAIGAAPQSRPTLNFADVAIRESDPAAGGRGAPSFSHQSASRPLDKQ